MTADGKTDTAADLTDAGTFRHWTPVSLRFSDQDSMGHINNVAYAAYVEQARVAFIDTFLRNRGDLTEKVEAEYDQKITQRLILQPRVETELSAQDIPERGIGAGLTKVELGLRLRYEIAREFAPYVGVEYEAKTSRTANITRLAGEDPDGVKLLFGVRAWF